MRAIFSVIATIVGVIIVAALVIFALQNVGSVHIFFLGATLALDLWWLVVGAAILGVILAFLVLVPAWVASGWRGHTLRRHGTHLEQELAHLREKHAQLQLDHQRMQAERDHLLQLRAAVTETTAATQQPTAPTSATAPPSPPPAEQPPTLASRLRAAFRRRPASEGQDATWEREPAAPNV